MNNNLSLSILPNALAEKMAVNQILATNETSEQYALKLSEADAGQLVQTRNECLKALGRIEIGGGIVDKIVLAFCDSPYLWQGNYAETLNQLVELFYLYKEETLDSVSDDDLIDIMKDYFDNRCGGSVELLLGRELYRLAHNIRFGLDKNTDIYDNDDNQEDDDDWEDYDQ
jgi:hypothetical protein